MVGGRNTRRPHSTRSLMTQKEANGSGSGMQLGPKGGQRGRSHETCSAPWSKRISTLPGATCWTEYTVRKMKLTPVPSQDLELFYKKQIEGDPIFEDALALMNAFLIHDMNACCVVENVYGVIVRHMSPLRPPSSLVPAPPTLAMLT